jgi:hypothetical protein
LETSVIRKRLSTFRTEGGYLKCISDDVLIEVLRGWESWTGNSADYYREIGVSREQLGVLIRKGKQLIKSGKVTESEFKEIAVSGNLSGPTRFDGVCMELRLEGGKAIRFSQVDQLVDFLKKSS